MTGVQRRPTAFRLDDPDVAMSGAVRVVPEPEGSDLVPVDAPIEPRRFPWAALFWSSLGGLVALGLGLAITTLIGDLYARATWLGALGAVLAGVAVLALLVVIVKEALGLARLRTVELLRARAQAAITADDREEAQAVLRELMVLLAATPRLARPRAELRGHLDDIIDGADLVRLTERELMAPLDEEARRLVSAAAKRVSVVTAISPRAAVDMLFVLLTAVMLVRRLAALYGGRPGVLGLIRLVRLVVAHLAVTGGIAAGDSLIQQLLGQGVAAKLSARLGEGLVNGLLTARIGLAAIDVARPLPFSALPKPVLADIASGLLRRGGEEAKAGRDT